VAYLARPCQYLDAAGDPSCQPEFWTSHRFAPEVIAATDQALTTLLALTSTSSLQLVGYSGGGAVAALVAAQRDDVVGLRSVAGNLDHQLWTARHRVDPLAGSLNPVAVAARLRGLPQLHFVGGKDKVVPAVLAESFLAAQGAGSCAAVVAVAGAGHATGWADSWPTLLATPFPCRLPVPR
jgi:pimeloyl-ACP methyl ester carboxylesterase